jgi:16S rRNA (adenine1518-N6/adenine1519-N6)-dimethyltransferase
MIEVLELDYKEELQDRRLTLVHGDILSAEVQKLFTAHRSPFTSSYKLVANIPYYITGEIMRTFLQTKDGLRQPTSITVLVQKEVAERVARSAKESVLSLSVKAYGTPKYVATVPAGAFSPPPTVDSAVLHIAVISKRRFTEAGVSEGDYFTVVKTGLGSKRKMLFGLLTKKWPFAAVEKAFTSLSIPTTVRGEDLPLEKWLLLTKHLCT